MSPLVSISARTQIPKTRVKRKRCGSQDLSVRATDWSDSNFLVLEIRTSTPQRFSLWLHTANGKRRLMLQPFGQNVWLRASIPLQYFKGRDQKGTDLASASNRRTNSFWMSVWGPFGDLKNVEAMSVAMDYPLNRPTVEIRSIKLSKEDAGSEFIEKDKLPVLDEFGQWAHADWPRKIRSREQFLKEVADEEKSFGPGDFGYCRYGGYADTKAAATGFFRVEQIDGRWRFVDPDGHRFLSTGSNCMGGSRPGRGGPRSATEAPSDRTTATRRRLREFLAQGDTPDRRREFVYAMFERYLALVDQAIQKYDSHHLNLGIRFGGTPPEPILRMAKRFDACSINVYEYEPTRQIKRVHEVTGRPVVIGEFHLGVPADGLGAGLVQTANQLERAKGYRYYMEQAAALPGFIGAHWFQWRDEPVLGRMDGENYNIGFVDVTDRPYAELVDAAKATHKTLLDVHSGKTPPFAERPRASEAGTPGSPWSN